MRILRTSILAAVGAFCFLLVFMVSTSSANSDPTTYYVSTSGSDTNNGISWELAFATIQHAVDIASPEDTIIVGDGVYVENVTVNKANLTIRSENGPTFTIVRTPDNTKSVFEVTDNNVTISGFTIENTAGAWFDTGLGLVFEEAPGIRLTSVVNSNISNNIVNNNGDGIYLYHSDNNTLENNIINSNDRTGVGLYYSDNNVLENNTVNSNGRYGISLFESGSITLRNNNFVNDGIWVEGQYGKIVETGNIVENNTVNGRPLVYLENESNRTITDAGQVVLVGCDNITVRELDLSNASVGVELQGTSNSEITNNNVSNNWRGIWLNDSSNNMLEHNIVNSNNWAGIWLEDSSNNTLRNNDANNNVQHGIYLESSDNSTLEYNITDNNQYGIWLKYLENNIVENNDAGNNELGILLWESNNSTLRKNTFSNNHDTGVKLYISKNNMLENNTVSSNDRYGIELHGGDNNVFRKNTVNSNGEIGVYLFGSDNNVFENNVISNNEYGIFLTLDSANNAAHFNNIFGNSKYGAYNYEQEVLYAENNWWGDPSGPGGAGAGTGDNVDENIVYEPWLTSPNIIAAEFENDFDGDGMPDNWESQYGLDPNTNDASQDKDEDGYTNLQEYQQGTDPSLASSYPGAWGEEVTPSAEGIPLTYVIFAVIAIIAVAIGVIIFIKKRA